MKLYFISLILLYNIGCDSPENTMPKSSQQSIDTEITSIDNSAEETTQTAEQTNNPGEITFKIKIMDIYNSGKDICGAYRQNVMLIEVDQIIERGMGITNTPHSQDQLFVNFVLAPKDLEKNMVIEAIAKESLCLEASKSYFTINSYKILE